jgi:hypothetical protein
MPAVGCPKCGGAETKQLAPGYYECLSTTVVGVVPPWQGGNHTANPAPVTRTCGYQFQIGDGAVTTSQCACGMFAVGTCQTCGAALCGRHGMHAGGVFVCVRHVAEAGAAERAEAARRSAEARARAEEDKRRYAEARLAVLPEVPVGPADARGLSKALNRLVPSRAKGYVIGRKSFGRRTVVRGWGFALRSVPKTNHFGGAYYRHEGLIITDDGHGFSVVEESTSKSWAPGDYRVGQPPYRSDGLSEEDTNKVVGHLLDWAGLRLEFEPEAGPTPARLRHLRGLVADGRLSSDEAERLAPDGEVSDEAWAVIRER